MSVINQMLRDLEDRQPQQGQANNSTFITTNKSPMNVILFVIAILIILNVAGYFIWSLYSENKSLKHDKQLATIANEKIDKLAAKEVQLTSKKVIAVDNINKSAQQTENNATKELNDNIDNSITDSITNSANTKNRIIEGQSKIAKTEGSASINQVPIKVDVRLPEPKKMNTSANVPTALPEKQQNKPSSLVISRKKMTVNELVAQKLEKAQRAMNAQNITKAESLFEEILLLKSSHQYARKQLAALWYGRKSYQEAINLLQQGIANESDNTEYRLMQARIYNELGRYQQAFEVLSVLPNEANNDYQAMLASTAQQLGQHQEAISAYGYLAKNDPVNARWWLGLAISYDSNSQFTKAIEAYKTAITQQGLSANTRAFAQQRIEELGE